MSAAQIASSSLGEGAASKAELAALDVTVGNLTGDVSEINDRILGLDTKIDKGIASLASEFRSSLAALATQLSERNKTPWAVLIPAAAFLVTLLGGVGWQTLSPVRDQVNEIKAHMVPRAEVEFRYSVNDKRLTAIETDLREIARRREDEHLRIIERLERKLETRGG